MQVSWMITVSVSTCFRVFNLYLPPYMYFDVMPQLLTYNGLIIFLLSTVHVRCLLSFGRITDVVIELQYYDEKFQ